MSLGPIEPQFYQLLIELAELDAEEFAPQLDIHQWPALKARLTEVMKQKTRDEWCAIMEGTDVCFAPVLSMLEAPLHPHNVERGTYMELGGVLQPAPAPRFNRTTPSVSHPPHRPGQDTEEVLKQAGYDAESLQQLREKGVLS